MARCNRPVVTASGARMAAILRSIGMGHLSSVKTGLRESMPRLAGWFRRMRHMGAIPLLWKKCTSALGRQDVRENRF